MYNKEPRDWQNTLVITRFHCIKVETFPYILLLLGHRIIRGNEDFVIEVR